MFGDRRVEASFSVIFSLNRFAIKPDKKLSGVAVGDSNSKLENADIFWREQANIFIISTVLISFFLGVVFIFAGVDDLHDEGIVLIISGAFLCGFAIRYRWYARKPAVEVGCTEILVRRLLLPSLYINTGDVIKIEVQLQKIRSRGAYVGIVMVEYITITCRSGKKTQFIAPQFLSNDDLLNSLQLKTGIQVERLLAITRK